MTKPSEKDSAEEEIKKTVMKYAMKGEWKEVVQIYGKEAQALKATITRGGDTALHLAISDGQASIVKQLVDKVGVDALRVRNEHGNTPLHVAAYVGDARMCAWIAGKDPDLIGWRNHNRETPIFLAVIHGRKEAFLCMRRLVKHRYDKGLEFCGNHEGRSILHSAISVEHFDLAFQIMNIYPKLIYRHDAQGINPLHLLATKPSAFKSGTRMGLLQTIVYHCICIRKLHYIDEDDAKNSQTFWARIRSWLYFTNSCRQNDSENPDSIQLPTDDLDSDYFYCKEFRDCLSRLFKKIVTILTLGINHKIGRVIEQKRKNKWAVQIMHTLVGGMSANDFEVEPLSRKKDDEDHSKINNGHDIGSIHNPDDHVVRSDDDGGGNGRNVGEVRDGEEKNRDEEKDFPSDPRELDPDSVINAGDGGEGKEAAKEENSSSNQYLKLVEKIRTIFETAIQDHKNKDNDNKDSKFIGKMLKQNEKKETPLLIAAKHGIIEMVECILKKYPVAVHNENVDGKNIVLIAVESRQPHIYKFLLREMVLAPTIFYKTDKDGNSALHLAAMLANRRNWLIPGPALQMQWEIKWYEFVENSMPPKFFMPYNNDEETPWEIFRENHKDLVNEAKEWLYKTSESCSVVAVLIATVAFTASATVPGGTDNGTPVLAKQPAFNVFAIASLVALCFSIASVVMFMAFFTSRHREKDYGTNLPAKLLVELTSLLISIAAVLVSFCAAHFFVIKDTFKYTAFCLYAATLFPVALYAFWQIPMYSELVMATWRSTPNRVYEQD